jgi:hypothetical protein
LSALVATCLVVAIVVRALFGTAGLETLGALVVYLSLVVRCARGVRQFRGWYLRRRPVRPADRERRYRERVEVRRARQAAMRRYAQGGR